MTSTSIPYEKRSSTQDEVPVSSRRSGHERDLLRYLKIREEIDLAYQAIREKKRELKEIIERDTGIKQIDSHLRRIPRKIEEEKKQKKRDSSEMDTEGETENEEAKKKRKKLKNVRSNRKRENRELLEKGWKMKEEKTSEGQESFNYVYFRDLGGGRSEMKTRKGVRGLKLATGVGELSPERFQEE